MKVTTSIRVATLLAVISLFGVAGSASAIGAPPPPAPTVGSVDFPYEDFYAVPQLGTEEVVGSDCGANGSIGDTIPDGIWRGYVESFDGPTTYESTSLEFNLICVYVGATGDRLRSEWEAANQGAAQYGFPDGFMVDNNPRTRGVPLSVDFVMAGAVLTTLDRCAVPAMPAYVGGDRQPDSYMFTDAWLVIQGGEAVTVVTSCANGGGEVVIGCFHGGYVEGFAPGRRPRCE